MKDHIVNKRELKRRLEAKGWPFRKDHTLYNAVADIDGYNKGVAHQHRKNRYTVVFHNGDTHDTVTVLIPYLEPATVQNLMAEYHKSMAVIGAMKQYPLQASSIDTEMAKMAAIEDMLANGIDTTPFGI